MTEWTHVQLAGDMLEVFIYGDDACASPNGKQASVKVTEKTARLLIGQIEEKLDLQRKLKVLAAASERAGDSA